MSQDISLSKALSYILRHGAVENGLKINNEGYVLIDDIRKLNKFKNYEIENFIKVVEENDKKRFSIKEESGKLYIRANQGHSGEVFSKIKEDKLLKKIDNPLPLVVHGTTYQAWNSIKVSGLKKMGRSHIHFAINDDFVLGNKQQSGIRFNCEVLIYLNMALAMSEGIKFFISENNVVLSPGVGDEGLIDKKYFKNVVDRKTNINIDF